MQADTSGHDDTPGEPPCALAGLDASARGYADAETARDVARWRVAERARLLAVRLALNVAARQLADARLAAALDERLGSLAGLTVATYWPFRGEPDLRPWAVGRRAGGVSICLPVVVEKARPLVFRQWSPDVPLVRGVWNIPIPPEEAPALVPDLVIAPVVGADAGNFRLGYGGGYYDRTLAAMSRLGHRPRVIGVGYDLQRIATIFPQPHDVPMTEMLLVET